VGEVVDGALATYTQVFICVREEPNDPHLTHLTSAPHNGSGHLSRPTQRWGGPLALQVASYALACDLTHLLQASRQEHSHVGAGVCLV
jgi:hypothetical protein